ncbi:Hypothetical predicted protein [Cloeon dipterum]|uniref:Uncharacterized protein n=1 Tax=Cloeon dipterum TaxID=197152 RepID=A0A8S1CGV3_9INSE|nr:Hypothetical predicted protein [Cloeon dipterum]
MDEIPVRSGPEEMNLSSDTSVAPRPAFISRENSKRSVHLRSPSSLKILTMDTILKNCDFYENKYNGFSGFQFLTPPVLQILIEYIDAKTDRFLTPNFAKMLLNENTHFANIGSVDEKHRQDLYDYMISNCSVRLKIIQNLWLDANLQIEVCDLLKFKNLVALELLQLECTDEILDLICANLPELRSLGVTFMEYDITDEGLSLLPNLQSLVKISFRADENDHSDYTRMLQRIMEEFGVNWELKSFYVPGLKRSLSVEDERGAFKKPVAGRIGSYIKKKLVRAFSKEGGM